MRLFGLDPKSAREAGPYGELYAADSKCARQKMHFAYPEDGWLDEKRFDCGFARRNTPVQQGRYCPLRKPDGVATGTMIVSPGFSLPLPFDQIAYKRRGLSTPRHGVRVGMALAD